MLERGAVYNSVILVQNLPTKYAIVFFVTMKLRMNGEERIMFGHQFTCPAHL